MPSLSIIPSAAVADERLTDLHIRVLCAIGTFSNRLGGNVWASVQTLASQSRLSTRSVQRALPGLIEAGYIRHMRRPGKTSLYEIVLEPLSAGVTGNAPEACQNDTGGDTVVASGVTTQSPKRYRERYISICAQSVLKRIWTIFPARDEPVPYPAALKAISTALSSGATDADIDRLAQQFISAAESYAQHVQREGTEKKYRKSMVRFFTDGAWEAFTVKKVHGRTREEWARSGQDVAEWDKLAGNV